MLISKIMKKTTAFVIIIEIMMSVYVFMVICIPVFEVYAFENDGHIVLTEKKIESYNAGIIQDILNQISGVHAGESSVSIRGSYKVKVLLDGRVINDPTSSFGGVKWETVPLKRISKIEIIKSGGSVVYGDDASGGVIVITTKQIDEFRGQFESHCGNYQTRHYFLNVEQKYSKAGMGLSTSHDTTDGFQTNDDEEKKQFEAYTRYQFSPETRISISGNYLTEKKGYAGLPEYPTPNARNHYRLSSGIFSADFKHIKNKLEFISAKKENTNPDKQLDTCLSVEKISNELTGNVTTSTINDISWGCGIEYAKAYATQFDQQKETKNWVCGTGSYTLSTIPLTFSSGLRGVYYSEFHGYLNPEGKIIYKKDNFSLQLSATHTHNTPSFHQRFYQSSSTQPNPDLTVETANNFNLSITVNTASTFSFQLSPFFNYIQDRITYVRDSGAVGRYENFGKVSYKGFDAAVECKYLKNLSLKMAYTYLKAKNELTNLWLPVKSKHRASVNLLYNPIKTLSMRASVKYVSRAFTRSDNTEYAPEYTVANIRSEYKIRSFHLYGEIKNLADKKYIYVDGYQAPPRTWIVGMRYQF